MHGMHACMGGILPLIMPKRFDPYIKETEMWVLSRGPQPWCRGSLEVMSTFYVLGFFLNLKKSRDSL